MKVESRIGCTLVLPSLLNLDNCNHNQPCNAIMVPKSVAISMHPAKMNLKASVLI